MCQTLDPDLLALRNEVWTTGFKVMFGSLMSSKLVSEINTVGPVPEATAAF